MRLSIPLFVLFAALLSMGNTGCQSTDDTVVVPEGPKATELGKAKDEQIAGLVAQVKAEQAARELEQANAALVAANLEGILFAAQHVDTGLPRDAIEAEAKLGRDRGPAPNAAELLKAKDRVIAILNGEVEKAKEMYSAASTEAAQSKATIAAKDKDIAARDETIKNREARISVLTDEAEAEKAAHAKDVTDKLAAKDAEIAKIKSDAASKERATWVLWARIAGLGLVVIGVVTAVVFHIVAEGAGLALAGVIIGLISIFVDWLTSQVWFNYACGGVLLAVLILGARALWQAYKARTLLTKVTGAIQDIKDEAASTGSTLAKEVQAHLDYRLGDKGNAQLTQQAAALNLTNPVADAAAQEKPSGQ